MLRARYHLGHLCHKSTHIQLLMCPSGTELRRLLLEGWVFVKFGDTFFHVGMTYLSPQRMTYLKVHVMNEDETGRVAFECRLQADGLPETYTDIEIARELDLGPEMSIQLYKLESTERPHIPFTIGNELFAEPMDRYFTMQQNEVTFWNGADAEMRAESARRLKRVKTEAEKRKKAEAKARADPQPAPANARGLRRPVQRPRNSGIPISADLTESAGSIPFGDGVRTRPARASDRLYAARDYDEFEEGLGAGGAEHHHLDIPGGEGLGADWSYRSGIDGAPSVDVASGGGSEPSAPSGHAAHQARHMCRILACDDHRLILPGMFSTNTSDHSLLLM